MFRPFCIFSLLFAFWFQNAAQKRLSSGLSLSQVTNTVNISMSGFIIGCLIGTCFTIFIICIGVINGVFVPNRLLSGGGN